jgi:glucose/arabinose dehydrogenase
MHSQSRSSYIYYLPIICLLSVLSLDREVYAQTTTPANVTIHSAYQMRSLATGLDFPTAIAFSGSRVWVCEAGIFDPNTPPAIKELSASGTSTTVLSGSMLASGHFAGPLTALAFRDGMLWVAHRYVATNGWMLGAISKFHPDSPVETFTTVITGLPSAGDHYTEDIAFDAAGRVYFSQGTASNSGVVGADNEFIGQWLSMAPGFHDYPAKRIVLSGASFQNQTPFALDPAMTATTAPFRPFGSGPLNPNSPTILEAPSPLVPQDEVIAGNGTVYSFDASSTNPPLTLRLEAWGLRNPYGIGFDPFLPGRLFISNNGADTRTMPMDGKLKIVESRPIGNDWDDIYTINVGGAEEFFGWPDFFHDPLLGAAKAVTDPYFCATLDHTAFACPDFLLHAATLENLQVMPAYAQLSLHSSANKFAFSTDADFRFVGDMFVAETGAFVPATGAQQFAGYKVVRVDRATRTASDFIAHRTDTSDDIFAPNGFNKPIDVKFRGATMFVVDFGVFEPGSRLMVPRTGKVWMVELSAVGAGEQLTTSPITSRPGTIQGAAPNQAPTFTSDAVPGSDPRRTNGTPSIVIESRQTP